MQPAAQNCASTQRATNDQQFPPLEQVNRPTVPTHQAAYYLNRRPQTLRGWACLENGALRPTRVSGRLAWPVAEIRRLLGVGGGA
ncbi:MAG: hypothetical protein KA781_02950 [Aquabacterium sp.]|jgi:hypothetical protein|nr:hypothetical protein [Aquabacterium sp.]